MCSGNQLRIGVVLGGTDADRIGTHEIKWGRHLCGALEGGQQLDQREPGGEAMSLLKLAGLND